MSTLDKQTRWGENRYYSLDFYLKETFGHRLYKLALDGGMNCPNRDGTLDTRGCIFCSTGGSGDFAISAGDFAVTGAASQIEAAKALIAHKVVDTGEPAYIAYFQAYTNTWPPSSIRQCGDSVTWLRERFLPVIQHPEIAVLSIATRPDCLTMEICDLLAELSAIKPVWVELGLQTCHEHTARWLRRGYENAAYEQAVQMLHDRHIPVITHLILGLDGETKEDMLASVRYINQFHPDGVKFHLLHVLEGTDLADEWKLGHLHTLSEEEYIDILVSCLAELDPTAVVHRITGDGPPDLLLAPDWSRRKKDVLNHIRHELKIRDIYQGINNRKGE